MKERELILRGVKYIDEIVPYDTEADLLRILTENTLGIDVRILGAEYKDKPYTGRDLPLPIYYNTRDCLDPGTWCHCSHRIPFHGARSYSCSHSGVHSG